MSSLRDLIARHGVLAGLLLTIAGAAVAGVALLGSTGCSAQAAATTTRAAGTVLAPLDLPAVNDPALHDWMQTVASRFDELARRDAELAARSDSIEGEASAPRSMSLDDWLYALLGIGGAGGGAVLAARSMHGRNAQRIGSIAEAVLSSLRGGASIADAEHQLRTLVEQLRSTKDSGKKHAAARTS